MKRKLNESYNIDEVRLDLTAIAKDDRSVDFNDLADTFITMGADVDHDDNGHVIMVINGLSKEKVANILNSVTKLGAKSNYFVYDGDSMEEPEITDYPDYDEVDDGYTNDYPDYDEVECYEDENLDPEMDDLSEDVSDEHDEILNRCTKVLQKAVNLKQIFCEDDIEDNLEMLMDQVVEDPEELTDDEYNELADIFHEAWELVDFDLDLEDEDYVPRIQKIQKGHHMMAEKRKKCCPGKKLNERLKAFDGKDQKKLDNIESDVKKIVKDLGSTTIGAHEAREAFKKLKAENAKLHKIEKEKGSKFNVNDVPGVKKALKTIKKADPDNKEIDKFQKMLAEKVDNHLKLGKEYLHENVSYKGKSFKDMTVFELKALYDKMLIEKAKLSKTIKETLNESDFNATKIKLQKNNQFLNFLDEELTYRVIRKRCLNQINEGNTSTTLNEDGGEISDEELANLFGPGQGEEEKTDKPTEETSEDKEKESGEQKEDNKSDESSDDDEEVELSRIEITLKTKEAAEDLKQACLDADIPEDAIEIEDDIEEKTDEDESDEDKSDEEPEDNTEEDQQNESLYYGNIKKLLTEGEVTDDQNQEDQTDGDQQEEDDQSQDGQDSDEDSDEDSDNEEKGVKFILTNTDYAFDLLKVLDDQYGISKDEFEEMIGASIVDEAEDSKSDEDESATEDNDSEDNKDKEDEQEIDPADLFKGL